MENKEIEKLNKLSEPLVEYWKNNWDSHCTIIITDSCIKLVRDEIGIPVAKLETAPEVQVQEQFSKKIIEKLNINVPLYLKNLDVNEGSITHDVVVSLLGILLQVLKEL